MFFLKRSIYDANIYEQLIRACNNRNWLTSLVHAYLFSHIWPWYLTPIAKHKI